MGEGEGGGLAALRAGRDGNSKGGSAVRSMALASLVKVKEKGKPDRKDMRLVCVCQRAAYAYM